MAPVLDSALKAVLDGLRSAGGPGEDVAGFMAKLGFDVPPGARDGVEAIFEALPTGGAVGTGGGLDTLLAQVRTFLDTLQGENAAFVGLVGGYGDHLKSHFPRRLIDYVIVTETRKRAPLLAGLLRLAGVFSITTVPAPAPLYEVPGTRHAVDLDQLLLLVRDPAAGLRWGRPDFRSGAVVWGLEDMVLALQGQPPRDEDERLILPLDDETDLLGRATPAPASAAAAIPVGPAKLRLAGLHEQGIVVVPIAANLDLGLPDPAKNGIRNATGIDPAIGDNPGIRIGPGAVEALPRAGRVLPGGG